MMRTLVLCIIILVCLLLTGCFYRPVEYCELDSYRKIIMTGETERLHAVTDIKSETLFWESSDETVITADAEGNLFGVSPGNAVVTVSTAAGHEKECFVTVVAEIPENLILFIGDGMGFEQIKAAGMYKNGSEGTLSFESLDFANTMTTYSASSRVTDSAASATAMATGRKVTNGVISMAIPGKRNDLESIVETLSALGKKTGLVTTCFITHATPAGFGAHTDSRFNVREIAADYLSGSRPNILFGGGENGLSPVESEAAGYHTVTDKAGFIGLVQDSFDYYSAQFGTYHLPYMYDDPDTYPQLSMMTEKALELLETSPNGFFLMIEGGRIDQAGHDNDIARNIFEVIEFEDAIDSALAWMSGRDDTVIIVTADHETGGLKVLANNGPGVLPDVSWSTDYHTSKEVPVLCTGSEENIIFGEFDNTHIHDLIADFYK
ncbi:MAG: alkaline phosphatase [Spirochaetales bacterium]|nr:alkaline phosphatase [Spirochaetales bacterium]